VLAECADIAVGDAWLPGHVDDPRGTNVAVIRSPRLKQIISDAERQGDLTLEDVSPDIVSQSQAAGLRHRRQGLMHRLARRRSSGQWAPKKRVPPRLETNASRRQVYDLRLQIAQESSAAFAVALETRQLGDFEEIMTPTIAAYRMAIKGSMAHRFKKQVISLARLIVRRK
jgi:coenzyme F420 hydrogenase subunit beta